MPTLINNSTQKAFTTLARMKTFLGIGSDTYDSLLIQLINQVTGFIEQYTKRSLLTQTYTNEEYDGSGGNMLVTKQFPVTTFTSLQERDTDEPDVDNWTTMDDKEYYWYDSGVIVKRSGNFTNTPQKYRMTYVAGFKIDFDNENTPASHTLPMELEYICQKLTSALFNTRKAEGFDSSRMGDIGVTLKKNIFGDSETKAILDKYAKPTI